MTTDSHDPKKPDLPSLASRYRRWLAGFDEDDSVIRDLLNLDEESLTRFVDRYADTASTDALRVLSDRSHGLLARTPRVAVTFAHLAVRLAQVTFTGDPETDAAYEGDAWKAYAEALFAVGDLKQAQSACEQAQLYYDLLVDIPRGYERTILALTAGQVMHALGSNEDGLRTVNRAATDLLIRFDNKRKYVDALTIYGALLLADERVVEAAAAFEQCAALAKTEGYVEPLAYMLNNVGLCYVAMGDLAKAKDCILTALTMFEDLKLTQKIPRARGSLAAVLVQEGRYNEAISEMWKNRAAFIDLGMPIVAAQVTMRIVQVLFAAGRYSEITGRCLEAYDTFANAGLPREAMKALAYISQAAHLGVTEDEVTHVHDFLARLQDEPDAEFVAPEG